MTLDTVAMAYPIDNADLLPPALGNLLVHGSPEMASLFGDHPDLEPYRTVEQTWRCLAGETGALPPTELLGTPDPGAISFIYPDEMVDWSDFYADILGPPLAGSPLLGDIRRTPKGTPACTHVRPSSGAADPVWCKRAARKGSTYCDTHGAPAPTEFTEESA